MLIDIAARAFALHERLGARRVPVELRPICEALGVHVVRWELPPDVREVTFRRTIAVSRGERDIAAIRHLVAHGLGHQLLHAGNQLSFWRCLPQGQVTVRKQEAQAELFARHLLIPPAAWVEEARFRSNRELARRFRVPVGLVEAYARDVIEGRFRRGMAALTLPP